MSELLFAALTRISVRECRLERRTRRGVYGRSAGAQPQLDDAGGQQAAFSEGLQQSAWRSGAQHWEASGALVFFASLSSATR